MALTAVVLLASTAAASWVQGQASSTGWSMRTTDGDTVMVDVTGDGTATLQSIRNSGIQTMELGECHSTEASQNMNRLSYGKQVKLTARYASATSKGRPVRYVDVMAPTGTVDTQLQQLNSGHALPMTFGSETLRWRPYWTAAQKAARGGQNLWDRDYCRPGPSQSTSLKLWVSYDADHVDSTNVNGEYVRVRNQGSTAMSLQGWWIRTGGQDSYFFPATAVIQPRSVVTLYAGKGTRTATKFFWGSSVPKFSNFEQAGGYGGGSYLFDPDGDLRAQAMYPCLYACTDTRASKLAMTVKYDAAGDDWKNVNGEYVTVKNISTTVVDLSFTVLASNGDTREFGAGTKLFPGETMVTRSGYGPNSRLLHYWNHATPILTNAGGSAKLRTTEGIKLVCKAWGTGRC